MLQNNYYLCPNLQSKKGLTGFDSGQKRYVSMQCVGDLHFNLSYQEFIWQQ